VCLSAKLTSFARVGRAETSSHIRRIACRFETIRDYPIAGIDKYSWEMLIVQVPEGAILTVIMLIFFELFYRPKAAAGRLAMAEQIRGAA
jgi:hypothetical protein